MIKKFSGIGGVLFFVIAATLPLWLMTGEYVRGLGVRALTVAALAVAWNIVGGFGGRLSFGHAAFFGIGAYTSSLLLIHGGISPWLGGLVGMAVAGLLALLLGIVTVRLRGIYFTLVTFVFALILLNLARYFSELTGGDVGLSLPLSAPSLGMLQFKGQLGYYYVALGTLLIYVAISVIISKAPFGYRLRALRDDEEVAEALGVAAKKAKLQAFVLSAMMVAFVGTLLAQHDLFVDPGGAFGVERSVEMALGAIFGGIGTVWGPVVGGIGLVAIAEWADNAFHGAVAGADAIVYALVLISVALWLPGGLASITQRIGTLLKRRKKAPIEENSISESPKREVEVK